jgi:hypothetical protein
MVTFALPVRPNGSARTALRRLLPAGLQRDFDFCRRGAYPSPRRNGAVTLKGVKMSVWVLRFAEEGCFVTEHNFSRNCYSLKVRRASIRAVCFSGTIDPDSK